MKTTQIKGLMKCVPILHKGSLPTYDCAIMREIVMLSLYK